MSFPSLAMSTGHHRDPGRRMLTLTVQERTRISPHFVSLTLGGNDVQHLEQSGFDQAGRLFIPGPTQGEIAIPTSERWRLQLGRVRSALRPRVRTYSIRRFGPEGTTFDVEVAVHEGTDDERAAPGSTWALQARPGQKVGFLDEGLYYAPVQGATWQLLVGDESALPAILSILERSSAALPAEVFLEVPTSEDVRSDRALPTSARIHWLPRDDAATKPGTLALQAVKDAQLPSGRFYTWAAGESALATGIRRHLVSDQGVPRSDVAFMGYWKHGRASL